MLLPNKKFVGKNFREYSLADDCIIAELRECNHSIREIASGLFNRSIPSVKQRLLMLRRNKLIY